MKPIKVTEETYNRIKAHATVGYRSLGAQVELILDEFESVERLRPRTYGEHINEDRPVSRHLPKGTQEALESQLELGGILKNTEPSKPRDKEILDEINAIEDEMKENFGINQDPDYWEDINVRKKALWDEWHQLTGE